MTHKQTTLYLFLVAFLMCMAGNSFAQHTADTLQNIDAMNAVATRSDTAMRSIDKPVMQEVSPEIIMHILRHGTMYVDKDPFSLQSAQYPMMLQPETPYKNNIDAVTESIQKSLNEYYKKYHQGQLTGEVLSYLSLLLIFL